MKKFEIEAEIKKRYRVGDIVYGMGSGRPYKILSLTEADSTLEDDSDDEIRTFEISVDADGYETSISVYRSYADIKWAKVKRKSNINNSV